MHTLTEIVDIKVVTNLMLLIFPLFTTQVEIVYSKESANHKTRESPNGFTRVVSHAFSDSNLSAEDKMDKKTLEDVHTYAELKLDPHKNLPESFTICSTLRLAKFPSSHLIVMG